LKARLEQQQSDVTVADKQVAYWDQQLDDTIIRAPFTGIVTSKNAQPGEMISPISAGAASPARAFAPSWTWTPWRLRLM
jgi:multidrug resistance efflux pump